MLLLNPMQFTYKASLYSHMVPFLVSWPIALFCLFLSHHGLVQLPAPLEVLPSLQGRAGNSLFRIPQQSHITLKSFIQSQTPPNGLRKSCHSPLMWTEHNAWHRAINGPGQYVLLRKNKNQNKSDFGISQIFIPGLPWLLCSLSKLQFCSSRMESITSILQDCQKH